jgi:choline dehydrogenase-like flavoprotein
LDELFGPAGGEERGPQTMPMAAHPAAGGELLRSGPSRIFPPIAEGGDPGFVLMENTLVTSLQHEDGRVSGAVTRDTGTGAIGGITARVTVVCADALRTPQLLFASGIRPAALGRFLNEHAFVTGRVLMDLPRFGLDLEHLPRPARGEFATDALWLPQNGPAQPFHGQITGTVFVDDDDAALAYSVGLSFYAPVESSADNRLVFSESEVDATGMPRIHVEFSYSEEDWRMVRAAEERVEQIARIFGSFDPSTERALLPPGSSLHQTGTVRMGTSDDGTSVCDPSGRVWGFDNLFVAGNGAVPTPVVCNATLTGSITAIRAARAAVDVLRVSNPSPDRTGVRA